MGLPYAIYHDIHASPANECIAQPVHLKPILILLIEVDPDGLCHSNLPVPRDPSNPTCLQPFVQKIIQVLALLILLLPLAGSQPIQ
jgi:hypothetical protein